MGDLVRLLSVIEFPCESAEYRCRLRVVREFPISAPRRLRAESTRRVAMRHECEAAAKTRLQLNTRPSLYPQLGQLPPDRGRSVNVVDPTPHQAKFQKYLALSDTFVTASMEQGSTDSLPLVRTTVSSLPARVAETLLGCIGERAA